MPTTNVLDAARQEMAKRKELIRVEAMKMVERITPLIQKEAAQNRRALTVSMPEAWQQIRDAAVFIECLLEEGLFGFSIKMRYNARVNWTCCTGLGISWTAKEKKADDTLTAYMERQREWSRKTFGEGPRVGGITQHIEKELGEIRACPTDVMEWVDVIILAMDGYWRNGGNPETLFADLQRKQAKNLQRRWPKPKSQDDAVEHLPD